MYSMIHRDVILLRYIEVLRLHNRSYYHLIEYNRIRKIILNKN